jgi:hypothetical protein
MMNKLNSKSNNKSKKAFISKSPSKVLDQLRAKAKNKMMTKRKKM